MIQFENLGLFDDFAQLEARSMAATLAQVSFC